MPARKPKAKPEPKPIGRPSSYKPEYAKQAQKLCRLGATDAELSDFFEVSLQTLANWKNTQPEFFEALKAGKDSPDDRVERSLYQKAVGYTFDSVKIFMPAGSREPVVVPFREHVPPDTTACIFWLKNRRQQQWRDVHKIEHGGPGDFSGMSAEELAERAKEIGGQIGMPVKDIAHAFGKVIEHEKVER